MQRWRPWQHLLAFRGNSSALSGEPGSSKHTRQQHAQRMCFGAPSSKLLCWHSPDTAVCAVLQQHAHDRPAELQHAHVRPYLLQVCTLSAITHRSRCWQLVQHSQPSVQLLTALQFADQHQGRPAEMPACIMASSFPFELNPHHHSTCCRECVINTLEGPGIVKSQCPACKQPAWKKDLHTNHKYTAVADAAAQLQDLLQQGACTAGWQSRPLSATSVLFPLTPAVTNRLQPAHRVAASPA